MLQTSVIIPYFNRAIVLKQVLLALAKQTVSPKQFEVIVVDDGSTDQSSEIVLDLCLPYSYKFLRQENRGPGAARNCGAQQAQTALLVFLDADMIPAPDLLQKYLTAYQSHPQAIYIGRQLPWPKAFTSPFDRVFNYVLARDPGPQAIEPQWYYLASGNFALGSQLLRTLGGFDEQLKMTEDTDLAYRAYLQGIKILYNPAAIGYHNHPKTLEQLCSERRSSAWWTARLMTKHPAIRGELPVYQDIEPIRFEIDSVSLVLRKLARQLLAKPIPLVTLEIIVKVLERLVAYPPLLEFLYWKILNSYRLIGFRAGFKSLKLETATDYIEPKPEKVITNG